LLNSIQTTNLSNYALLPFDSLESSSPLLLATSLKLEPNNNYAEVQENYYSDHEIDFGDADKFTNGYDEGAGGDSLDE
jgi:hypothetical protein